MVIERVVCAFTVYGRNRGGCDYQPRDAGFLEDLMPEGSYVFVISSLSSEEGGEMEVT